MWRVIVTGALLSTAAVAGAPRHCVIDEQSQGIVRDLDARAFAPYERRTLIDWFEFPCDVPDIATSAFMHTPRWRYGEPYARSLRGRS